MLADHQMRAALFDAARGHDHRARAPGQGIADLRPGHFGHKYGIGDGIGGDAGGGIGPGRPEA
jgi:hypothetical protein